MFRREPVAAASQTRVAPQVIGIVLAVAAALWTLGGSSAWLEWRGHAAVIGTSGTAATGAVQ